MTNAENYIQGFVAENGRAPRILHIGNICNNAYQISKMLNEQGADCDVLSVEYYHIMASPEWDDADFSGDIINQNFPSWHKVDLHGFERPEWFCASSQRLGVKYLLAKRRGDAKKANALLKKMERYRRYLSFKAGAKSEHFLSKCEKMCDMIRVSFSLAFKNPRLLSLKIKKNQGKISEKETAEMYALEGITEIVARVKKDAETLFPEWGENFEGILADRACDAVMYQELFAQYDFVHAYSGDPIWPYLAGNTPYIAYENGTLRYLPVQNDEEARLLMLAYARANAMMLTNTDCYDSAKYISKIAKTPMIFALHGLDVQRMAEKMQKANENNDFDARFGVSSDIPLFFCPSRHTWDEGLSVYLKGEDKALRAAMRLAEEGHDFRLVMTEWGEATHSIKEMIEKSKQLARLTTWIKPIDKMELHKAFTHVDAVLDQFYWKVFGAITFEVLCANTPLIASAVQEKRMQAYFGANLPYYACEDEEDIYKAMKEVVSLPQKAKEKSEGGRDWILKYHSDEKIVAKCYEAYKLIK